MKLLKPAWVNHEGNPIYSIDIHPDGSRFATGGQGADTGRVIIWNMAPVLSEEDEQKETVPKLISQMDNHLACVNCVRWSRSGKFLASGGDDRVIIVWAFSRTGYGGSATFGGTVNIEHWRAAYTLRGHSGDILDLCWSNQDEYLASCSVDNSIIIWNALKFPDTITVIRGHAGLVKGVCWDPVGKYIASQSDDKTVKIWRTGDWKQEASICEPFMDCGGTTHVLRLHWSPDGQYLVSAHAMNNRGSTAQIIERDGWRTDKDFVGHRKAVTCVRFSSHIMTKKFEDGKEQKCSCLAIGSRDRSLSVWLTNLRRPLVVIHDLFVNSLLDLSWSNCGYKLASCSWDGTVAFMEFDERELGQVLSGDEMNGYMQSLYGGNASQTGGRVGGGTQLIEDVNILKAREEEEEEKEEKAKKKTGNGLLSGTGLSEFSSAANGVYANDSGSRSTNADSRSSNTSSRLIKGPTDKQIETRMADGRRRITPLYIPPPINCDGAPMPFNAQQTTFSSSTESRTKIIIERRDESSSCNMTPKPQSAQTPEKEQSQTPSVTTVAAATATTPAAQSQTVKAKTTTTTTTTTTTASATDAQTPTGDAATLLANRNRSRIDRAMEKDAKRKPGRPSQVPLKQPATSPERNATIASQRPLERKSLSANARAEQKSNSTRLQFTPLKLDTHAELVVHSEHSTEQFTIEARNDLNGNSVSSVTAHRLSDNLLSWQVLLTARITALCASDYMVSVANEDNTLSVFDFSTGRRLHPPILISAQPARLHCYRHYLMVITIKGSLSLWNFDRHQSLVKNESLLPLLTGSAPASSSTTTATTANPASAEISIIHSSITDSGSPLISLSNGRTFVFDTSFTCWSLVANSEDILTHCCDYRPPVKSDKKSFPLAVLQSHHKSTRNVQKIFQSNSNLQKTGTLSYIDQQLASAFVIGSTREYKYWLLALAKHLTGEGLENRLRELCQYLLGPVFRSASSVWQAEIVGNSKRELLNEILKIMTGNLKLQRVYTEFKDQLDLVTQ